MSFDITTIEDGLIPILFISSSSSAAWSSASSANGWSLARIMHELPAAIEWASAGGSMRQRRIVAALIVSSEAWRCSEGVYKIREAPLSANEGSGSGCALPQRPPCLRRRPVLNIRNPGVLGSRTLRRTNKYASGPVPRYRGMVARWHEHLHDLAAASRA